MNRVIYNGGAALYQGKIVDVDGQPMLITPTHYRRTFKNEDGGFTTELSLTPFKDK